MSKTARRRKPHRRSKERREERSSLENPNLPLNDPAVWAEIFDDATGSDAGVSVTPKKALSLGPVFQAIDMISGDLAKIPLAVYRRADGPLGKGTGKERDAEHPAYGLVHLSGQPNEETSAYEFWRRMFAQALLYRNAYAMIARGESGRVEGLYNLLPDRTEPHVSAQTGKLWYVTEIDRKLEALRFEEVLHLRGFSLNNLEGVKLIGAARQFLGKALAASQYESKFFSNNATLGGILHVPPGAAQSAINTVEAGLDKKFRSAAHAFKSLVLRDGFKYERMQSDPKGAMLDSLDDRSAREAARFFNLPPSRLGLKDSVSYGSAEGDRRFYHDSTLSPWLHAAAAECNLKLRTPAERKAGLFFEHVIDALNWADASTRSQIFHLGIQDGVYCPDEARAAENRPPRPDGKGGIYAQQMNMKPATGEGSGDDEEETPPKKPPVPPTPPADPPADDEQPEEDRSAKPSGGASDSAAVALAWFRDAYGRAQRRLDNATKRARDPVARQILAQQLDEQHREALTEILQPAAAALSDAGWHGPTDAVAPLLLCYRNHLAQSTDLAADLRRLELTLGLTKGTDP